MNLNFKTRPAHITQSGLSGRPCLSIGTWFEKASRKGLKTTWFPKLKNILRTSLGGMIWWGIIWCIHYVIWKISISNIFWNVHILARSDFIKLKNEIPLFLTWDSTGKFRTLRTGNASEAHQTNTYACFDQINSLLQKTSSGPEVQGKTPVFRWSN